MIDTNFKATYNKLEEAILSFSNISLYNKILRESKIKIKNIPS